MPLSAGGAILQWQVLINLSVRSAKTMKIILDSTQIDRILEDLTRQIANDLEPEQQMAAIGRGLMSLPKIMMFDEPSLGLAPILVQEIFAMIRRIKEEGVTILLVEQNVTQTIAMCDRAYVLENGRIVLEGTGSELMENEKVKEAFLGI